MTRTLAAVLLLLAGASAHGDVFRILDDPREAMQARVDLIQQAEHDIAALYFLARNDRVTLTALALLRDARRRGVGEVRLIVDANFHRIPKAVLAHLREEGVEIRVYHPLTLRHPSWLFRRMHEKVLLVDRARYVAGGRNLAEPYFGLGKKKNYIDRDVYVEGSSAVDAAQHFENLWSSRHVARLRVHVRRAEIEFAAQVLDGVLSDASLDDFVELDTGRDWSEGQKEVDRVRFLHDPVRAGDEGPRVATQLAEMIGSAERSIVIESPYFVPPRAMLELLERKLAEGVTVTVLTNSLRSTDGILPQAGYLKYRRRLMHAGVELHEYKGPDPLHAKSIVIDGQTALIGSYNLDPRSQNLNTEVMCAVEDEEIARELLASIQLHLTNAWTVQRSGRPLVKERDPVISRVRSFRAWAARLLLPFVENQL